MHSEPQDVSQERQMRVQTIKEVDARQASQLLGVKGTPKRLDDVYRLLWGGQLKGRKFCGHWLIQADSIRAYKHRAAERRSSRKRARTNHVASSQLSQRTSRPSRRQLSRTPREHWISLGSGNQSTTRAASEFAQSRATRTSSATRCGSCTGRPNHWGLQVHNQENDLPRSLARGPRRP